MHVGAKRKIGSSIYCIKKIARHNQPSFGHFKGCLYFVFLKQMCPIFYTFATFLVARVIHNKHFVLKRPNMIFSAPFIIELLPNRAFLRVFKSLRLGNRNI